MATEIHDLLNKVHTNNETVLHQYARENNKGEFRGLISKLERIQERPRRAFLDKQNTEGQTALHLAVMEDNIWQVEQLMKLGADLDICDNNGNTPFLLAIAKGHYTVAASLVRGIIEDDVVKRPGANWQVANKQGFSFFSHIKLSGSKPVKHKPWREVHNELKLRTGYCNTYLLTQNNKFWAERNENHLEPDAPTWLPPGIFRSTDALAEFNYLKNGEKVTLLAYATLCGWSWMVDFLLDLPVNVNQPLDSYYKETPLHLAVRFHPELVSTLLEKNPELNCQNGEGWTPLYYAVLNKNSVVASELLQAGADPDRQTDKGNTPLHQAVSNEDLDRVYCLLTYGASTIIKNEAGYTAVDMAQEMGFSHIEKALQNRIPSPQASDLPTHQYDEEGIDEVPLLPVVQQNAPSHDEPAAQHSVQASSEPVVQRSVPTQQNGEQHTSREISPAFWNAEINRLLGKYQLREQIVVANKEGGHNLAMDIATLQTKQAQGKKLVVVQGPDIDGKYGVEAITFEEFDALEGTLLLMEDGIVYQQAALEAYLRQPPRYVLGQPVPINTNLHGKPLSLDRSVVVEVVNGLDNFKAFLSATAACHEICQTDKYLDKRGKSPDYDYFIRECGWEKVLKVLSSSGTVQCAKGAIQRTHDEVPEGRFTNRFRNLLEKINEHLSGLEGASTLPLCVQKTAKISYDMWSLRIDKSRQLGVGKTKKALDTETDSFTPCFGNYMGARYPSKKRTQEQLKQLARSTLEVEANNNHLTRERKPNKPGSGIF